MTIEIHCAGGCGAVLGTTEVENQENYQGDNALQMYCDNCVKPNAEEITA